MPRYMDNEENYTQGSMRQKDLVLSTNEFVFIQSKTNGQIKTYTGPIMVTISAQESMVVFNSKTKRFEETGDFEKARQLFTSAPEGWYVVLKNPSKDGTHPDSAKAMNSPELNIGKKINVAGPCSFSLYPGQMAKVIQGHRLRSNQYLIARVYDADAASKSVATIVDAEGKEVKANKTEYFVGQLLVIKGTEVSFYMPPTGIEVIAENGNYVRDAVTLERLEYVILKDESGSKRYVAGPSVVFPEPTETFVLSGNKSGGVIFRALELSPISGIYVKVIADYKDDNGDIHKTGEELFITGKDQMIYYPRPEHALIQYDGKYMHHAIAIPEGEGRYVLDRLTGKIRTVTGPAMYLPDPRTEVIVKRKLTRKECELFYPGNSDVIAYNESISESAIEKLARSGKANAITDAINTTYSTANATDSLAIFEATANISRGVSYTKPRTITLDTKYEGVVSIDVWNGYAVCVVSKTGNRELVVGPTTRLLDYDETLETIETIEGETVFLKLADNKICDVINAQTSDYVDVQIKLSYDVDFCGNDKWFDVNDYSSYIKNYMKNALKRAIREYTIQDFYANHMNIIRATVLDEEGEQHIFKKNNSIITNVDVVTVTTERAVAEMISSHKAEIISKQLELAGAGAKMKVVEALAEVEKQEANLKATNKLYKIELDQKVKDEEFAKNEAYKEKLRAAEEAEQKAKSDMQEILNKITEASLVREKAERDAEIEHQKALAEIEKDKQEAYAATVVKMLEAVQPGLIEALNAKTNSELMTGIGQAISPYAMAEGKSVADTVTTLLRGTSLEDTLKILAPKQD